MEAGSRRPHGSRQSRRDEDAEAPDPARLAAARRRCASARARPRRLPRAGAVRGRGRLPDRVDALARARVDALGRAPRAGRRARTVAGRRGVAQPPDPARGRRRRRARPLLEGRLSRASRRRRAGTGGTVRLHASRLVVLGRAGRRGAHVPRARAACGALVPPHRRRLRARARRRADGRRRTPRPVSGDPERRRPHPVRRPSVTRRRPDRHARPVGASEAP